MKSIFPVQKAFAIMLNLELRIKGGKSAIIESKAVIEQFVDLVKAAASANIINETVSSVLSP